MIGLKDVSYILNGIEGRLPALSNVVPLPFDKWLISSGMQKAVRRGHRDIAIQCAGNLWSLDRQMLWRRICVIALEDIGIGNIDVLSEVLAVCADWKWRKSVGDLRVALYLINRMASAIKSRTITHVYMLAELSKVAANAREDYAGLDGQKLEGITLDNSEPLINRAVSLWYVAGQRLFPSDYLHHREGDIDAVQSLIANLEAPYYLSQTCILNLKRLRWPGTIFAPLVYSGLYTDDLEERCNKLPEPELVKGMPKYACDGMYTRLGKKCLRQWREKHAPLLQYTHSQLAHALFYTESEALDKELDGEALTELKMNSTRASLLNVGVSISEQSGLLEVVKRYMPELSQIREREMLISASLTQRLL